MDKVLFSHNCDDWATPKLFLNSLIERGFIDTFEYKCSYDQYTIMYQRKLIYINPPFSQLNKIPSYIYQLLKNHNKVLLLLPSRTDTVYFHQLLEFKPYVYFIKGRLHFNESKKPAPFPCMLLWFDFGFFKSWGCGSLDEFLNHFDYILR